ncbi:MAG: hypothetical protein KKH25_04650, partial [Candidatus Omnitrophica bacterium]|nr:hypothetical protein [Candidatus Omnitrophota bacterium]
MPKDTVYLVDGTSLCYRSFFAIKLSNSKGLPTGSVYGVYQTLKRILAKSKPLYMGFCFDVSRKTFRQEKFKEYKIQRPPTPDDLKSQIPLVKKLVTYLGIVIVEKEGFEADDVIASLCQKAVKDGHKVVIVTSDKDLIQLIGTDGVSIYNYHKDSFITKEDFIRENRFQPEAIIDYLALCGDASDNIPGAKGIGKIGAAKLIREFETVENIFKNLDKLSPKMQEIFKISKDSIALSKELVTLKACDIDLDWQGLKIGPVDTKGLYDLFGELEFKSFLKDIPAPSFKIDLEVKDSVCQESLENLVKEPLALVVEKGQVFIYDPGKNLIYKLKASGLKNILADSSLKKISHGFKQEILAASSQDFEGIWFDTKIAAYLLDSNLADYELESLVFRYLGKPIEKIPVEFKPYFIYKLYRQFSGELKDQGLDKLFFQVEMPLITVLSQMQEQGVRVQINILEELLEKVDVEIENSSQAVFKEAGHEFNLNSPKQLAVILFQELGIKPLKKTKTGYSTNEAVLERLALTYPIAASLIEHRHLNKLKNTYIVPLIEQVKANQGVLHTQFNQTAAGTGRLSSSSPNLQSIPQKGEFSENLRRAFISAFPQGCILSGDYSQIELRILAHLSGDDNLIEAFSQDLDIHTHTASLLFSVGLDKVSDLERNIAKRVNFGIIYGMSSWGLAKELGVDNIQAQNFIDDYFKR